MENQNKLSRRKFFQLAVIGSVGILLFTKCNSSNSIWRFFSTAEAQLMDALADQIIPPDEWPGGRESGVSNFIDKQLIGPYKRFQPKYRRGLKAIHDNCEKQFNRKFEDMAWDEQTAFLEQMESGTMKGVVWADGFDQEFFGLIRDHSMQAFYGSSRHGGNKDNVSYKMLKLDYPLIVGQNRYKI